ncbi:hypothetical protein Dda_1021 [Drechslerella dactyloides]|uniref:SUN domain-containing protein n=1 Tax=Drechslerella dactyloides TaxID=74499 RepID=A0AAD6J5C4_DREDA|nr:hypothetical protein Dda_1021 [Drechslerella dactyloides]
MALPSPPQSLPITTARLSFNSGPPIESSSAGDARDSSRHPSRACQSLLLLLPIGSSSLSLAPTVTRGSSGAGGFGVSTCPFRTANYITHGLPQQCLRASRVVSESANATGRRELSDAAADSDGNAPSLNTEILDLATTTSINLNEKFEAPQKEKSSPSSASSSPSEREPQPATEDAEAPIDTAKFLSFEEWKAKNLAKAGQSAENFGERAPKEARRRPGAVPSALDALGEDAEIDLSFDGSESGDEADGGEPNRQSEAPPAEAIKPDTHVRSKDAGKTCKERFNYASFDCAATVHRTNPESKGASAILVENKDSYMLNKCGAKNKFLIVELCDDILVDTVVLANYEFFSSMFRTFRVSVSDRYPVKSAGWKDLGVFEARNTREIQAFLIESPLIWARYIRLEFLTHYGKEFYCPISLLRVHGTTMMEEFRHQEEAARGDHEDDSEDIEPEAVAKPIEEKLASQSEADAQAQTHSASVDAKMLHRPAPASQSTQSLEADAAGSPNADPTLVAGNGAPNADQSALGSEHQERDVKTTSPTEQTSSTPPPADETASAEHEHTITTSSGSASKSPKPTANEASHTREATLPRNSSSTAQESPRHPSPASVAAPTPTTQESFFKTIHKRLQLLEANATLSLQYIEEQSRLMRDTFSKMEKRQFNKSASYLDQLNATVFRELREFRMQYDQLWQSTVIALDTQRELSEREIVAISARLTLLADEVVFQKRMTIAQSFLMILVVCIVVFTKTQNFDARFARTFSSRSQDHLVLGLESPPTSPSPPPKTRGKTGGVTKKRMREYAHQRRDSSDMESSGGKSARRTPIPQRFYDDAAGNGTIVGRSMVVPASPPLEAQVTQSSPATPSGGMRRVKEQEGAWIPASASDGEYATPDVRVAGQWRATSPLSRQVTSEGEVDDDEEQECGEQDDEEEEEMPDVNGAGTVRGDCEVDSYFLSL